MLENPGKLPQITGNSGNLEVKPIAFASTWHKNKNGTPRQGVINKSCDGILDISVCKNYHKGFENPHFSLENLEQFSHIWILFHFHQNGQENFVKTKVAPPRLKGEKVGLFSTRSPHRPNPIGLTLAKLIKVEGTKIHLQGLDLIDQTPILDIKPYIPQYDIPQNIENSVHEEVKIPDWIDNPGLEVNFTPRSLKDLQKVSKNGKLKTTEDLKEAIENVLKEDPRSNYRREKCSDRLYFFDVDNVKVTCWFDDDLAEVLKIQQIS